MTHTPVSRRARNVCKPHQLLACPLDEVVHAERDRIQQYQPLSLTSGFFVGRRVVTLIVFQRTMVDLTIDKHVSVRLHVRREDDLLPIMGRITPKCSLWIGLYSMADQIGCGVRSEREWKEQEGKDGEKLDIKYTNRR
jgi:hypothetical protein